VQGTFVVDVHERPICKRQDFSDCNGHLTVLQNYLGRLHRGGVKCRSFSLNTELTNYRSMATKALRLLLAQHNREFMQITTAGATTAGATTAAVTEKVWGEYLSVVCQL